MQRFFSSAVSAHSGPSVPSVQSQPDTAPPAAPTESSTPAPAPALASTTPSEASTAAVQTSSSASFKLPTMPTLASLSANMPSLAQMQMPTLPSLPAPPTLEHLIRQPGSPLAPDLATLSNPIRHPELKRNASVRVGKSLTPEEIQFRKARAEYVAKEMSLLFGSMPRAQGEASIPKVLPADAPTVAIVASGGGCRAMISSAGNVLALHDAGIFDCVTYWAGISGATWTMGAFYTNHIVVGDHETNQGGYHDYQAVKKGEDRAAKRRKIRGLELTAELRESISPEQLDLDLHGGLVRYLPPPSTTSSFFSSASTTTTSSSSSPSLLPWWTSISSFSVSKEADWWRTLVAGLQDFGKGVGNGTSAETGAESESAAVTGTATDANAEGTIADVTVAKGTASGTNSAVATNSASAAPEWFRAIIAKLKSQSQADADSTTTTVTTTITSATSTTTTTTTTTTAPTTTSNPSPQPTNPAHPPLLPHLPYPAYLSPSPPPPLDTILWNLKNQLAGDFMSIGRTVWMMAQDPVVAGFVGEGFIRKLIYDHPEATLPPLDAFDLWSTMLTARLLLPPPRNFPPGPGDHAVEWRAARVSKHAKAVMEGKVPMGVFGITGEGVEYVEAGKLDDKANDKTGENVKEEVETGGEGRVEAVGDPSDAVVVKPSMLERVELLVKSVKTGVKVEDTDAVAAKSVVSTKGDAKQDSATTTSSAAAHASPAAPPAMLPKATFQFYEFTPFEFSRVEKGKEAGVPIWAFGRHFENGQSIVLEEVEVDDEREKVEEVGASTGLAHALAYAQELLKDATKGRAGEMTNDGEAGTQTEDADNKVVGKVNAVAMPEMPFGYLLGIGSSAFLANFSVIYQNFETDMPLFLRDKVKSLIDTHATSRVFEPALIRNPFYGMDSLPADMSETQTLTLMDGGMRINTPFLQMLREGRNVDIFIGLQHSADLYSRRMDLVSSSIYAYNNGIKFPYLTVEDLSEKMMLEDRVVVIKYVDYPQPKRHTREGEVEAEATGVTEDEDEEGDGPDIVYFPLVKNPGLEDKTFSPVTHPQCSTFNFAYSRDTTDKLFETSRLNVVEGVSVVKQLMRDRWLKKKANRERREEQARKANKGTLSGLVGLLGGLAK
ncbi:hypothetical protein HDU93_005213 [Gonapodya sp. JEL0774]|nr:hypothetical protein HDU93_005213 [Gonapodya sp. JEL0774]